MSSKNLKKKKKQECILVGCVLPAHNHTAAGGLPDRDPPWTETPQQRPPMDRDPRLRPPVQRSPWTKNPTRQRPLIQRPTGQRPSWTETPLDRDSPGERSLPCEQNHRQV